MADLEYMQRNHGLDGFIRNLKSIKVSSRENCIGIDWSNNGKFPEFFVAVYGNYIFTEKSCHSKKRTHNNLYLLNYLQELGFDYKFLTLEEIYLRDKANESREIAISLLIKSFDRSFSKVIIDGNPPLQSSIDNISNYSGIEKSRIIFEKDGDRRFPLLNIADTIAYGFLKAHRHKRENFLNSYERKRIYFPNS